MTTLSPASNEFAVSAIASESEALYQIVKRSDMNPADVEDATSLSLEVTVMWERSVLHVAHLDETHGFSLADHADAEDSSRFVVDAAVIGGSEARVVVRDAGATRFVFLRGARGEVELDGVRRDLAALGAEGIARPSSDMPGALEISVVPGGRYRMELAGLVILARVVAAGRRFAHTTRKDPALRMAWAGSALAVAAFLGLMRVATHQSGLLVTDDHDARLAELRDFVARQSAQMDPQAETQEAAAEAPAGAAHQGAAGSMGNRQSPARDHRYEIRRRSDAPPQVAREHSAREEVSNRGIFVALGGTAASAQGSHSGIVSPWGAMTEAGAGERDANGNINGADVGDSFGLAGLDTMSSGVGGGGHDVGIGTGPLGTLGHGNCRPGEDCAYGRTRGTIQAAPRATHGPRVTPASHPDIAGTIAPEAIRRVVLRNIGQVNRCYEQGLSINPSASGRVAIRFVIAGGGAVLAAGVMEDGLGLPSVSACIAGAVRRWNFPVPSDSGAITVTYPFTLMPADL